MQAHVLPRAATMTGTLLNICVSSSNRLEAGGKYFSFQCIFGLLCIFWPVAVVLFSTASQIKPQQLCRVQGGAGLTEAKRCWGRNKDLFQRSDTAGFLHSNLPSLKVQPVQSAIAEFPEKEISDSGVTLPHFWLFHCSLNPYNQFSSSAFFCACLSYFIRQGSLEEPGFHCISHPLPLPCINCAVIILAPQNISAFRIRKPKKQGKL